MNPTARPRQTQRTIAPLFTWRSAISESSLPPTTRHVLLALSLYMNERGGSAFPGSARLARDTGLHQATVKGHLLTAVKLGWLRVVQQGGSEKGGHRLATEYVAAVPVDNRPGAQDTGSGGLTDRSSSLHRPGAQDDPISSGISPENSRVASQTPEPDPACVRCLGTARLYRGGDANVGVFDAPCSCCDPRPVVAVEGLREDIDA